MSVSESFVIVLWSGGNRGKCRRAHLNKTIAKCTRLMKRMTMDDISSNTCHAHGPRIFKGTSVRRKKQRSGRA